MIFRITTCIYKLHLPSIWTYFALISFALSTRQKHYLKCIFESFAEARVCRGTDCIFTKNRQDQSNAVSVFVCILLLFSSLQQQRIRSVNGAYKNRTSTELCALFSKKLPQTGPHTRFMNVAKMWPMKAVYRTHTAWFFAFWQDAFSASSMPGLHGASCTWQLRSRQLGTDRASWRPPLYLSRTFHSSNPVTV